jgi:regulator of protease activity HflC (stomatin/prohibitin superfamily)
MTVLTGGALTATTAEVAAGRASALLVVLVLGVLFLLTQTVHLLPRHERLVIVRGRRRPVSRGPGLVLALPWPGRLHRVRVGRRLAGVIVPVAATADGVRVRLEGTVEYDVADAALAAARPPETEIHDAASAALQELVDAAPLGELAELRHRPLSGVAARIGALVDEAGLTVQRVEISALDIVEVTDVVDRAARLTPLRRR